MPSLACNNVNIQAALSSWASHLLFVSCRFKELCVHNHRCTCRVCLGFGTSSSTSSIPWETEWRVLYLWSPFPLAAPCHFPVGYACACVSTHLGRGVREVREGEEQHSKTQILPGLNLVLPGITVLWLLSLFVSWGKKKKIIKRGIENCLRLRRRGSKRGDESLGAEDAGEELKSSLTQSLQWRSSWR